MLKNETCGDSCTAAAVNLLCPALSSVVPRSSRTLVILKDVVLIKQTCFLLVVHRTFLGKIIFHIKSIHCCEPVGCGHDEGC